MKGKNGPQQMSKAKFFAFIVFLLFILFYPTNSAYAHPIDPPAVRDPWQQWNWNPTILLGLGLITLLYARGLQKIKERRGKYLPIHRWRAAAFLISQITIFAALISPLDAWASLRFSAHMFQHILLMHVAALLIVLSYPLPFLLLGLPGSTSARAGRWWAANVLGLRSIWRFISRPVVVWFIYVLTVWGWHFPGPYTAAVLNEWVHFLEHTSFLFAASLFWWTVVHYFGRHVEKRGIGVLFLFVTAISTGVLGALLTFSTQPWYPIYVETAAVMGISAVHDQNLAGLIMWVPEGVVYTSAALILMKTWLEGMDRQSDKRMDAYLRKKRQNRQVGKPSYK
jgi:putative membrane protein